MKYTYPFILITLFVFSSLGCQNEQENNRFGSKVKEILSLEFKDITMNLDFKDTVEVARFQETVEFDSLEATKFELATKIAYTDDDTPVVRYDVMEVDTVQKTCVRHYVGYNIREESIKEYVTDTTTVEDKVFVVGGKEYPIYKIVEENPFGEDCRSTFISPVYGTLFGRGEVGRYEITQQSSDTIVAALINQVRSDTLFVLCGLQLEFYKKSRGQGDAVISPE